ncbi:zinc-binding dehydrogenase [Streptomyces sp. DSM 3412]|uniref:Zinc-binding dehydrogenase n=1 Tax=Streptomyces gottesmaniae TaxID=3075518 RepID=A0ABU2YRQ2_9ACTN|nr:zinc-binding dehydrogenase [Streptomyces sp. DSM 3412]MDT0566995.1 zinc-binding dehydrogenase [Streptomyces sp. DSM 3412]
MATTASATKTALVKSLGADVVIDCRKQAFGSGRYDYDVVIGTVGDETLGTSWRVPKPGGTVIGITGPPDRTFAREIGADPAVGPAMAAPSHRMCRRARRHQVTYGA